MVGSFPARATSALLRPLVSGPPANLVLSLASPAHQRHRRHHRLPLSLLWRQCNICISRCWRLHKIAGCAAARFWWWWSRGTRCPLPYPTQYTPDIGIQPCLLQYSAAVATCGGGSSPSAPKELVAPGRGSSPLFGLQSHGRKMMAGLQHACAALAVLRPLIFLQGR